MTNELATMTIAEIQRKLATGETTSRELTQAYLE
jgi:Asp-tRNA(Asn)/Glu-tRNA(Gln) amidotransferase A subunit family amidase